MSTILRRAGIPTNANFADSTVRYQIAIESNIGNHDQTRLTYMNAVEVAAQSANATAYRAKIIVVDLVK